MKSILDRTFKYYSAVDTDIRRTFRRVRRQLGDDTGQRSPPLPTPDPKGMVLPMLQRRKFAQ
jgi:hypothetical protein